MNDPDISAFKDEQLIAQAIYYQPDDRDLSMELNRLESGMIQNRAVKLLLSAWKEMLVHEVPLSTYAIEEEYRINLGGDVKAMEEIVGLNSSYVPTIFYPPLSRAINRTIARSKAGKFHEAIEEYTIGNISQQELSAIIGIGNDSKMTQTMTLGEAYRRVLEEGERERVHTGFKRLDHCLHGMPRGRVTILAARPAVGKTDLALSIAINVARAWKKVFFASIEMDYHEITKRIRRNIGSEADTIEDNIIIDDEAHQTVPRIAAQAMFCKPDLVIVDHLQIIRSTEPGRDLYTKTSDISNQLRAAAKGIGFKTSPPAWLVLSQLSRNTRTEQDRPTLADLRDSGAIEQDADSVLFLHEPDKRDEDYPRTIQASVAKNRSGPTGYVMMRFTPGSSKWEEK
jgi:replicative DNA helicase